MPNFLENFGIDMFYEDEESYRNFAAYCAQEGKVIPGYYDAPYIFKSLGDVDIYIKTQRREDGNLEFCSLDSHCSGWSSWEMRNLGIDLTPEDALPTERVYMFKRAEDGVGGVPIHVINADVLPSYLENDIINMQMCALPLEIFYHADQEEYQASLPKNEEGKSYGIANGTFFPAAFLLNHAVNKEKSLQDSARDDQVLFTATVKKVYPGAFKLGELTDNTFIQCVADTTYGEIIFAHSVEQVLPEQRKNIHPGAIISGTCILSGDVAIDPYHDGIIKDAEHNLKLMRHTFVNGEPERLRAVLSEKAVYITDASEKTFCGADEIIARLDYVLENKRDKCFAHLATVTKTDDELEYPVGTRCIVLAYKAEDNYESIAFVNTDENGNITRLLITTDERYHFELDPPPTEHNLMDAIELPQSILKPIFHRAQFYKILDRDLDFEEFVNGMADCAYWETNAREMIEALKKYSHPDVEKALEDVLGYVFAKAIEHTVNSKSESDEFRIDTEYLPEDAFAGKLTSSLNEDEHEKLAKAMDKGKGFFKDYKFYTEQVASPDDDHEKNLFEALVFVQYIGSCYAAKLFGA